MAIASETAVLIVQTMIEINQEAAVLMIEQLQADGVISEADIRRCLDALIIRYRRDDTHSKHVQFWDNIVTRLDKK